jgi:glycopeptide antibiotics resistance protein
MQVIEFFPYPFLLGLVILAIATIRLRKRGWLYSFGLILFGMYLLDLVNVSQFPFGVPADWPSNLNWDQIALTLTHKVNLIPFNYGSLFADVFSGRLPAIIAYEQIAGNILVTLPFGIGFTYLSRWRGRRALWMALGVGLALEGCQLLIMLVMESPHAVDINDVLTNALGALIGYGLYLAAERAAKKRKLRFSFPSIQ